MFNKDDTLVSWDLCVPVMRKDVQYPGDREPAWLRM